MKSNSNANSEIRIKDCLYVLYKNRVLIAVLCVIGILLGIIGNAVIYMNNSINCKYISTASIVIVSKNENGTYQNNTDTPDYYQQLISKDIVNSSIYIFKSRKTIEAAIEKLGLLGVSVKSITDGLKVEQYEDTQIVKITFTWKDKDEGVEILKAITTVAPESILESLDIGSINVIEEPSYYKSTEGEMKPMLIAYLAVLFFMIGAGWSLVSFFIHPTMITAKDSEELFGLENLGAIPYDEYYFDGRKALVDDEDDASLTTVQESYAAVAHIVSCALSENNQKKVFFTSVDEREGKTVTAANVAAQLARLNCKVLLLDLDARHPSLAGQFVKKVEHSNTLNAVYFDEASFDDAVIHLNDCLDILPTRLEGKHIALDEKIKSIVNAVEDNYDYIIMDSAPVGRVRDSFRLKDIADAAILVIRQDGIYNSIITENVENLRKSGINIIGSIMNGRDVRKAELRLPGMYSDDLYDKTTRILNRRDRKATKKAEKAKKKALKQQKKEEKKNK